MDDPNLPSTSTVDPSTAGQQSKQPKDLTVDDLLKMTADDVEQMSGEELDELTDRALTLLKHDLKDMSDAEIRDLADKLSSLPEDDEDLKALRELDLSDDGEDFTAAELQDITLHMKDLSMEDVNEISDDEMRELAISWKKLHRIPGAGGPVALETEQASESSESDLEEESPLDDPELDPVNYLAGVVERAQEIKERSAGLKALSGHTQVSSLSDAGTSSSSGLKDLKLHYLTVANETDNKVSDVHQQEVKSAETKVDLTPTKDKE